MLENDFATMLQNDLAKMHQNDSATMLQNDLAFRKRKRPVPVRRPSVAVVRVDDIPNGEIQDLGSQGACPAESYKYLFTNICNYKYL
jgi:hypothetical protein